MNDKELADKVVALGVGEKFEPNRSGTGWFYCPPGIKPLSSGCQCSPDFVRDWRVAGSLMNKVIRGEEEYTVSIERDALGGPLNFAMIIGYVKGIEFHGEDESLPRAIIEACVEALS